MGFDIMNTLNAMKKERDAEISESIEKKHEELLEEAIALCDISKLFNPEKFRSDLKMFIEKKIAPEYFFDGEGIAVAFEKHDGSVLALHKGVDYTFALQNAAPESQKKYVFKVFAYPLRRRLKAFFSKVYGIMLSEEALETIYSNLTESGDLEVRFITINQFLELVNKNGIEATFCLDENPESEAHICRGVITKGKLTVFSSEKNLWMEERKLFKALL